MDFWLYKIVYQTKIMNAKLLKLTTGWVAKLFVYIIFSITGMKETLKTYMYVMFNMYNEQNQKKR